MVSVFLDSESIEALRGRPFWTKLYWSVSIIVSSLFGWALSVVLKDTIPGIAGSMALLTCFVLLWVIHRLLSKSTGPNFCTFSLLVQFFFRGAIVAVSIAMLLEVVGLSELKPKYAKLRDLPISLIVGFSEESGKFFSLLLGLCLVPTDLPAALARVGTSRRWSLCTRWWSVLIESPQSLVLAGIATGLGFMTTENIEYFSMIFSSLDTVSCIATALTRIFLNLHPLLTGLAAARLAHFTLTSPITAEIIFKSIWPSVLLHALFDFGFMFASDNPDDATADTVVILLSLFLIPLSAFLLISEYKSYSVRNPLQTVLV